MTRSRRDSGFGIRPFGWLRAAPSFVEGRDSGSPLRAWPLAALIALVAPMTIWAVPQPPPQRIVSLVPSVTETLFAIGAGPRVVAVSSFDAFPPDVEALPRVGALFDPDVERILSLRPDLVIVYGSQTELIAQLRRAGIGLYQFRHGSLADVTAGIKDLGERLGLEAAARDAVASIDSAFADIRASLAGRRRPKTMLVIGREPQSMRAINVSGGIGFLHDLVELAGGVNVFGDVKRESMLVSTETILARAPEVILELHYTEPPLPDAIARERATWQQLPGVPAVKRDRVYLLYGGELVVPGPRIVVTARTFARAIHPDVMPW